MILIVRFLSIFGVACNSCACRARHFPFVDESVRQCSCGASRENTAVTKDCAGGVAFKTLQTFRRLSILFLECGWAENPSKILTLLVLHMSDLTIPLTCRCLALLAHLDVRVSSSTIAWGMYGYLEYR